MHIRTIVEAEKVLLRYVPAVKDLGKNLSVARVIPVMERLGDPQKKLKVVHIAGTSGKTSTCYYIASLLHVAGKKVGLTVSPHIDTITERIQINGKPISEELFCKYLEECIALINDLPEQPSYFELLVALAYWIFYREGVDYAIIETGMGGLHDTTNVATNKDKVCVITDIGFDHMHILGSTIAEIAAQKAGIIQRDNAIFMYQQSHDVMHAVRDRCELYDAELYAIQSNSKGPVQLPEFQKRNWSLAKSVYDYIAKRDNFATHLTDKELAEASSTYIPARMDIINVASKTVVMDGAHNAQKCESFVSSFKGIFKRKKATVVLALKDGKEFNEVLDVLKPIVNELIITTFDTSQDLPAVSMPTEKLAAAAKAKGYQHVHSISSNNDALQAALLGANELVVVTGSFYLIAQLRKSRQLQHTY